MNLVVVDASALAEILLATSRGRAAAEVLLTLGSEAHAPHLIVPECLSVVRGWLLSRQIDEQTATEAVRDLERFPVRLWDERPFLEAWAFRNDVSAYDATYLVLTRALGAQLLTGDRRLARAARGLGRVHEI